MIRSRFLIVALLCACATTPNSSAPIPQAPPPAVEPQTTGTAAHVILLSFDGLGANDVEALKPAALMHLSAEGTFARVIPTSPTVTSTTHAAILTGADRERTGILSNVFHKPGTPMSQMTRGLETEIGAPTLLEIARAAGKRVGSIPFPSIDGSSPRRTPDWGLLWTKPAVGARVVHLTKNDFHQEWLPPGWGTMQPRHKSFSPALRTRIDQDIPGEGHEQFDLVAYDTTDDRVRNYDAFYVEHSGSETPLDAQRWFSVATRFPGGLYGSWSKLVSFDPALNEATLFLGPVNRNVGVPASYVRMIDDEVGFWPGSGEERPVDRQTAIEQMDRLSAFLAKVATLSIQRMPFDLLLAYEPIVDTTEHHYRGVDEAAVALAIADADRSIAAISNTIDPSRDALVVVGDHGVAHAETNVHINRILNNAGYDSHWTAYPTGNVVMFNRTAPPDDTSAFIDFLNNVTAPDGSHVFEQVTCDAKRDDITAFGYPKFVMTLRDGEPFTSPAETPGQHGGLPSHREYETILVAWGRGVARESLTSLQQTAVAGYVLRLLGLR